DFDPPQGLISHTAGIDGDGVLIVDVWDSAADFERLMGRAVPAMREIGVPPMEPRVLSLHNHIAQGAATSADVLLLIEAPGFTADDYDRVTEQMEAHRG